MSVIWIALIKLLLLINAYFYAEPDKLAYARYIRSELQDLYDQDKGQVAENFLRLDPKQFAIRINQESYVPFKLDWVENAKHLTLSGQDLSYMQLPGINLSNLVLSKTCFDYSNLNNAKLDNTNLEDATMHNGNLENAKIGGKREGVFMNMKRFKASNLNLNNVYLYCADMNNAELPNLKLKEPKMHYLNMQNAVLNNLEMDGGSLLEVNMGEVDLQYASLKDTKMYDIDLKSSDLSFAKFIDIKGCVNFEDAITNDETEITFAPINLIQTELTGSRLGSLKTLVSIDSIPNQNIKKREMDKIVGNILPYIEMGSIKQKLTSLTDIIFSKQYNSCKNVLKLIELL